MKTRRKDELTPKQRSYLGRLAKEAFAYLTKIGSIEGETEKEWRHREARAATKGGDELGIGWTISEAPRRAFDDLEARFLWLAGKTKKAAERVLGPSNDVRNVLHEIAVMMRTLAVGENYVAGICRRMFRGRETWETAEEGQKVLTALNYELERRQKKASRAALEPLEAH